MGNRVLLAHNAQVLTAATVFAKPLLKPLTVGLVAWTVIVAEGLVALISVKEQFAAAGRQELMLSMGLLMEQLNEPVIPVSFCGIGSRKYMLRSRSQPIYNLGKCQI